MVEKILIVISAPVHPYESVSLFYALNFGTSLLHWNVNLVWICHSRIRSQPLVSPLFFRILEATITKEYINY